MTQPPYAAPDFTLPDQNGQTHSLKDYAGNWLVLYFYPKDDTPGCTAEACSFRDGRDDIKDATGAEVVGVSMDDTESHQKFAAKHRLTFTLLSDESGETVRAYGAWGKGMYGKEGLQRRTYLIDPQGTVQKVYGRVTPDGHAERVLADLQTLKATA